MKEQTRLYILAPNERSVEILPIADSISLSQSRHDFGVFLYECVPAHMFSSLMGLLAKRLDVDYDVLWEAAWDAVEEMAHMRRETMLYTVQALMVEVEADSVDEAAVKGYGEIVKDMKLIVNDAQRAYYVDLKERMDDIECCQSEHAFREASRPRPKSQ